MKILITGAAGFIGFHLAKKFISKNHQVLGVDNINSYYDQKLKKDRIKFLQNISKNNKKKLFTFKKISIDNYKLLSREFKKFKPDQVVNLAAQAGVRYSLLKPLEYIKSNLVGFANILDLSKEFKVKHLIYASTSSVYGGSKKKLLSEKDSVDHPLQLYAATKRANELMAHSYSNLYHLKTTGLRFFTVYGPWGRPDMALFLFTKNILKKKPIEVFNYGNHIRDFTYIDDIVDGIFRVSSKKFPQNKKIKQNPSESNCPFRVLNIGNNNPITLEKYINEVEKELNIKAIKKYKPLQKGDVKKTHASIDKIKKLYGYKPKTNVATGIKKFVQWYKEYYEV